MSRKFWTYSKLCISGFFEEPPSNCQRRKVWSDAWTLVELLLAVLILGILSAIAVPLYTNYIDKARNTAAMADIRTIESEIVKFQAERGRPPDTLAEAGVPTRNDPWGNPYEYLRIAGVPKKDIQGKWRKDRFLVPINSDFDLYSMGKDGKSSPPLTAKASHDDIIRANSGAYVGLASEY
jgi:general secretion pathway protein G